MAKKGMSESSVTKAVKLDLSVNYNIVLTRNNVGAFKNHTSGQWTRYGLFNETKQMNQHQKSSDEIGWTPVVITPEMVGKTVAVFTAVEMKEEGKKPSGKRELDHWGAQQRFCDTVVNAGGIAGIVDCTEKGRQIVEDFFTRMSQ